MEFRQLRGQPARHRSDRQAARMRPWPPRRGLSDGIGHRQGRAGELPLDLLAGRQVQGVHQAQEVVGPHVRHLALRRRGHLHNRGLRREEQGRALCRHHRTARGAHLLCPAQGARGERYRGEEGRRGSEGQAGPRGRTERRRAQEEDRLKGAHHPPLEP